MLPIDVQAELIRSFQEEKRQQFEQTRQRQAAAGQQPGRLRRAVGLFLITVGQSLERTAGPVTTPDKRQLGWEK